MANYSISDLKEDLTGIGHGTNLAKVKNINYLIWRAGRNVLVKIDPDLTIKIDQITNAVHDGIYNNICPPGLKGKKVIDIRPQVNRGSDDSLSQRFIKTFDLKKKDNSFAIQFDSGEKILRLSKNVTPGQISLHQMNGIATNGTWVVGGDAENLVKDSLYYMSGGASLRFDLDGSGATGYIEISDMEDVDLEDEDEVATIFARVYLPDASAITSVTLRWGNDSSNYWERTVTTAHDTTSLQNGWNILAFLWNGATETGTVDPSAIDYLRLTITYDSVADTDFRVDKISCSAGQIWEIAYYSENLFRSSAGVWKAKPTDDTDIVNLDEDGYNILLNECGKMMAQQQQGEDSKADLDFFRRELNGDFDSPSNEGRIGLYSQYSVDHPSQALKIVENYYNINLYKK